MSQLIKLHGVKYENSNYTNKKIRKKQCLNTRISELLRLREENRQLKAEVTVLEIANKLLTKTTSIFAFKQLKN